MYGVHQGTGDVSSAAEATRATVANVPLAEDSTSAEVRSAITVGLKGEENVIGGP